MDDYLDSFENRNDAMRVSKDLDLMNLLKFGGFRLTKFVSKFPAIKENLNPSIDVTAKVKNIASGSDHLNSHVLGLKWNHGSDSLVSSRGNNRELQTSVTQRTVLSFNSSLFYPIGLVAPYTVRSRLLKDIWRITGKTIG